MIFRYSDNLSLEMSSKLRKMISKFKRFLKSLNSRHLFRRYLELILKISKILRHCWSSIFRRIVEMIWIFDDSFFSINALIVANSPVDSLDSMITFSYNRYSIAGSKESLSFSDLHSRLRPAQKIHCVVTENQRVLGVDLGQVFNIGELVAQWLERLRSNVVLVHFTRRGQQPITVFPSDDLLQVQIHVCHIDLLELGAVVGELVDLPVAANKHAEAFHLHYHGSVCVRMELLLVNQAVAEIINDQNLLIVAVKQDPVVFQNVEAHNVSELPERLQVEIVPDPIDPRVNHQEVCVVRDDYELVVGLDLQRGVVQADVVGVRNGHVDKLVRWVVDSQIRRRRVVENRTVETAVELPHVGVFQVALVSEKKKLTGEGDVLCGNGLVNCVEAEPKLGENLEFFAEQKHCKKRQAAVHRDLLDL
ncbi:hypothetical protein WICPIJ_007393 [Wickerhamomyces pijperi]|uniref:Uncharacterized protein n=1 Tax=Wickerhamomyces pijperi TaxID=599730 RepID=A0A9P8Q0N7_WICPI|nr:hypothetical protein WICPIJ_007393 [Wickerhamomyces pijperi]